jgi:hypothetical protein
MEFTTSVVMPGASLAQTGRVKRVRLATLRHRPSDVGGFGFDASRSAL